MTHSNSNAPGRFHGGRSAILATLLLAAASAARAADDTVPSFDPVARAAAHGIVRDAPCQNFFDGGLMGNGALGVVVHTRPSTVVLHLGHNSVWDIRAEEIPMAKLGTFEELWARYKAGDTNWVKDYNVPAEKAYANSYPRPWPCGSLVLMFDRRDAELLGHAVHLEDGRCDVRFRVRGRPQTLQIMAEIGRDRVWLRMIDETGQAVAAPFQRATFCPSAGMPTVVAEDERCTSFRQTLNALKPAPEKNRALRVGFRSTAARIAPAAKQPYQQFPANLKSAGPFIALVAVEQGLAKDIPEGLPALEEPSTEHWQRVEQANRKSWGDYWRRSGVALADQELERLWYRNQYFFNCVVRAGGRCPGLYGNWMNDRIGTVWHGEYVFDYNVEQVFWAAFSSNHAEHHLPYVDLIDFLFPVARGWAEKFYRLPGTFYAQVHWPVETASIHKPWFGWGNHLAPIPWAVQSLWWHYRYTLDKAFLRDRAFGPIKASTEFMNAYMRRADAHGPSSPWKDSKFHIYPTQSPEIWPEEFGKPAFSDDITALTLTKFLFKAYLEACRVLNLSEAETGLIREVEEVLANMPEYATDESPRGGRVFKDVAGASPDAIYNVPNPLMPVFPGEDYGLHSPPEIFGLATNTWRQMQNEGGNDLVFTAMQAARLGLLDLEKFKRHVNYCLLPNGTCAILVQTLGGRYNRELFPHDEWARAGIWIENFALPGVINECMLQSYTGELRFFPNWKKADGDAKFQTLRAVGAFLVSAEYQDGNVRGVQVTSEAGMPLKFVNPWQGKKVKITRNGRAAETLAGEHMDVKTARAEKILLTSE